MTYNIDRYKKPKKNRGTRSFVFLLVLASISYSSYWGYSNHERLFYYFKKDKYSNVESELAQAKKSIKNKKQINSTLELLDKLITDHPHDAYLYYLKGQLNYLFFRQFIHNQWTFKDIVFHIYINRYKMPSEINKQQWTLAISSFRKALALKVDKKVVDNLKRNLASLYVWGGLPYWQTGRELLIRAKENEANQVRKSFFNILLLKSEPDFNLLSKKFPKSLVDFWHSIYFLKIGNAPRGFSGLKKIANLKVEGDNQNLLDLKNYANFILADTFAKQKKKRRVLAYYAKIDLKSFLPKHKWFLDEYERLLRFLGRKPQAIAFRHRYDKLVNNKPNE